MNHRHKFKCTGNTWLALNTSWRSVNYRTEFYLVDETGLAHVWVTTEKQGPGVGVNGGQTGQMLTHWWRFAAWWVQKTLKTHKARSVKKISVTLFQIFQTGLLSFQDGAHAPQRGSLQLFTPIQRIPILHQTHIVFGNTGEGKYSRRRLSTLSALKTFIIQNRVSDQLTYQSNSWQCLFVPTPTYNGLCRTTHSSDLHRRDGCPERTEKKYASGNQKPSAAAK